MLTQAADVAHAVDVVELADRVLVEKVVLVADKVCCELTLSADEDRDVDWKMAEDELTLTLALLPNVDDCEVDMAGLTELLEDVA